MSQQSVVELEDWWKAQDYPAKLVGLRGHWPIRTLAFAHTEYRAGWVAGFTREVNEGLIFRVEIEGIQGGGMWYSISATLQGLRAQPDQRIFGSRVSV